MSSRLPFLFDVTGHDTHTCPTSMQAAYDPGEPGTENEQDEPVGSQIIELSSSRM